VILTKTDENTPRPRLLGGVYRSALEHHALCTWGPDTGIPSSGLQVMNTDSVGVLQNGVVLGIETFEAFKREMNFRDDQPDRIICHQVGATHQDTLLRSIGIPKDRDFTTFQYLGNIGTVSLPITAALAAERGVLEPGNFVGLLGIGSGLNCLMLGLRW
jgi:3-oxoacyl-[acyl-carrier-protein] synthase-3